MVPHLTTALTGPLLDMERMILGATPQIERWFRSQWQEHAAPFYTSVDLRNSGFKLAPVDTNLYPGGFNNLNSDFIPLAEETGVINQLTRWAVERGVRDLASLLGDYPGLGLSINISARDLSSRSLKGHIESVLSQHQMHAQRLTLELTETAAMEDPEKGLLALKSLADSGIGISIDDFGSGYSSLSYLKEMPATEIKLDRTLATDVCASDSSRVIIETAINMVHSLGYSVIAEGVEDEATARLLKELGCDKLQGYWLGHPMPMTDLHPWLAGNQLGAGIRRDCQPIPRPPGRTPTGCGRGLSG